MFKQEALRLPPPQQNTDGIRAFTLAEVLVTLGIIGVVAAMTMPTLINNQRKAVLSSQFKKQYNVL